MSSRGPGAWDCGSLAALACGVAAAALLCVCSSSSSSSFVCVGLWVACTAGQVSLLGAGVHTGWVSCAHGQRPLALQHMVSVWQHWCVTDMARPRRTRRRHCYRGQRRTTSSTPPHDKRKQPTATTTNSTPTFGQSNSSSSGRTGCGSGTTERPCTSRGIALRMSYASSSPE